ncbi:hypothetical protein RchiOBHm_Chr6g0283871 [Rosa chinensis]|uniref:Uncharacterized protein n=1 Tax=Rosa chinensis TaxID=74649 RepID=A0A2P6PU51_ROSCH|nr:hypothetical protein RchiOBHm_Chr6g0283871 [Rosa chinensis]
MKCFLLPHQLIQNSYFCKNQNFYMEANSVGIGKAQKDTSPNTLSWFFCMLSKNPLIRRKLHKK